MKPKVDYSYLIGQRFGKLTVESIEGGRVIMRCDCGGQRITYGCYAARGEYKSCGCGIERQSGKWAHSTSDYRTLYNAWKNAGIRCSDPQCPAYGRYGGRGIQVCEEWRDDFDAFCDWALMNGWHEGLTLDRIDNDGPYSPENCRWVDTLTQANNMNTNRRISYNGETRTISQWAK